MTKNLKIETIQRCAMNWVGEDDTINWLDVFDRALRGLAAAAANNDRLVVDLGGVRLEVTRRPHQEATQEAPGDLEKSECKPYLMRDQFSQWLSHHQNAAQEALHLPSQGNDMNIQGGFLAAAGCISLLGLRQSTLSWTDNQGRWWHGHIFAKTD